MTTLFNTIGVKVDVYRKAYDKETARYKEELSKIKGSYIGAELKAQQAAAEAKHAKNVEKLKNEVDVSVREDITALRTLVSSAVSKVDTKALGELEMLDNLNLTQAEIDLLSENYCQEATNKNYWTARKISELASKHGLELKNPQASIDEMTKAIDRVEGNVDCFLWGSDAYKVIDDENAHAVAVPAYDTDNASYNTEALVGNAEFGRNENRFNGNNSSVDTDAYVSERVNGVFSEENTTKKLHALDNLYSTLSGDTMKSIAYTELFKKAHADENVNMILNLSKFSDWKTKQDEKKAAATSAEG
jgi:hypothetical protein